MPLFEKWKRGFIAFRVRAPQGAAKDTSPLDHPSFQRILTLVLLIELAFAAWAILVSHNHPAEMGMAAGPRATNFLTDWVAMMVAMMFPAAALMILAFYKAQAIRHADEAFGSTWVFVTAYLLMWAVAGMAAYAGVLIAESAAIHTTLGPVVAAQFGAAILLIAGLYQFTPLKEKCLSECRTPIDMTTWHHDTAGSFRMGLLHGVYCLGCNWLLFAALFPLGMTIGAMAVITLVILANIRFLHCRCRACAVRRGGNCLTATHHALMSASGPKQTWMNALHMSAFGGKADMTIGTCPLSRSLLGIKRTSPVAPHMSAHDPKRTSITPLLLGVNLLGFSANWRRPRPKGDGYVRRRDFIKVIASSAVAWPITARAQQPTMPMIGFMVADVQTRSQQIAAFHDGLKETGYVQGQNVTVELRSAEGHFNRYPALAADLLRHGVAVLVAVNNNAALAAKRATATTPIIFGMGGDPVALGLVGSLNHPGGNITGIYFFTQGLEGKRLGLLHELVPIATTIAVLVNPDYSPAKNQLQDVQEAAARLGVQVLVLRANVEADFDSVFADLVRQRAGALLVCASPFFFNRRQQLVVLAARHAVPAIYEWREFAAAGGLMSYGTNLNDAYRQMGVYAGRILKGEKPADLPILQSTKFEFVLNLSTARALRIEVPPTLSARADEVIE